MTENTPTSPNSDEAKKEVAAKLAAAKSPDEVKAIAAENGKELTDNEAQHLFNIVQGKDPSTGKLSDEELVAVAGGVGDWNAAKERSWLATYQYLLDEGLIAAMSYDEYHSSHVLDADGVYARNKWISMGRKEDAGIICDGQGCAEYHIYNGGRYWI